MPFLLIGVNQVRILIAEDEAKIADTYRLILKSRGHEVTVTENGQECLDHYMEQCKLLNAQRSGKPDARIPFNVVILDYRMPVLDGMEAAKRILSAVPNQRIIFASAYLKETLLDSMKHLHRIVELLTKPFSLDELVDVVEDEHLYRQLQELNVDIEQIKAWQPSHVQIYDLLNGLMKIRNIDPSYFKKRMTEQRMKGT